MEKAPNIFLGIAITLLLYSLCKVEGIEIAIPGFIDNKWMYDFDKENK